MNQPVRAIAQVPSGAFRRSVHWPGQIGKIAAHVLLLIGAASMIVPFLWTLSTALKGNSVVLTYPPQFIPNPIQLTNFQLIFVVEPFGLYLSNSLRISILSAIGQLLSCSMAAYAFARLRFRGRDVLFILLVASLMVPYQVTMIPVFILMKYLGWVNTFNALIVPNWAGGAFGTFLLRQYFLTIPREIVDAARIDGSNYYGIYYRIFLPLAGPALATLAVFTFLWSWNDLLGPLIYLNSPSLYTVSMGMASFTSKSMSFWGQMMAASLVSLAPVVVVFLVAQKYFVQGIATTGLRQ